MELRPEEQDRADVYALLAALLLAPDAPLLEALALIPAPPEPDNEFAQAWTALVAAAERCGESAIDEYERLLVTPGDLGGMCEAMAVLIRQQRPAAMQCAFFADHLAGNSRRCLDEIAVSPSMDFYRSVARFAQAFLKLEEEAFALDVQAASTIAPIRTRKSVDL